ncbi:glycerol-3-phosphate dehydrogenase [Endozoicomonas sp. OPT23]|uniref:glycerol-3-phosphate dehydrogenase n=1 Tax=Endozoicomonas sp. OPT23 TaxID=2072845 RepID=UPI00129C0BAC|nr:glycerol-3-phosphate dehydrogenase [Endozoicomonas sp. OPT23]MRI34410.1 glycerol-3-phosphate dehydrogenase [Endozoicomonas sp. OPT23]
MGQNLNHDDPKGSDHKSSDQKSYDLIVIGGGINGTGIAADAAGRGLKVLLCEQDDLASATSSASSKLIHGGLRYLEQYEFRLVREALAEREVLLRKAPHIIKPLRFRLPHQPHLRPAWMLRAGLFLYDHLSQRTTLKGSHGIRFDQQSPLVSEITKGFEYSDAWVEDARLVVLNAMDAREHGATIKTRTRCIKAERMDDQWQVTLQDQFSNQQSSFTCKALVNASGPWVNQVFDQALELTTPNKIRLVRGSHIIVPKLHYQPEAYILQNTDNRIVFVIPFEQDFSLVGTTDIEHKDSLKQVHISKEEKSYLIDVANSYFTRKLDTSDIIHSYSGVRPLLDDEADNPQAITRDYTLELEGSESTPPLLSVYGGKITTYRKLAEAAVNRLSPFFTDMDSPWTATSPLPGGDFESRPVLEKELSAQYPWLSESLCIRLVRSYGTFSQQILNGAEKLEDLGEQIGADLYAREVEYLMKQEWACTAEDILWRRSKLGLRFTEQEKQNLDGLIDSLNHRSKAA